MRRKISLFLVLMICLAVFPLNIRTAAAEDYDFTERIVYGGTALDCGSYIYFANPDDGMKLYRRTTGSSGSVLIYPHPVGFLNILGQQLYFISENKIISTTLSGGDEQIVYTSMGNISNLYVATNCLYFLENNSVMKYEDGRLRTLFTEEGIRAFLPLSENEFRCYTDNLGYKDIDQTSDEIYEETEDKFLTYIYYINSTETKRAVADIYESGTGYTGPYLNVGAVTLPLKEYMPGTFFSKNGKACTCHHDPNIDCIESTNGCNCMRYWPTGIADTCEIDLLGAQCFAFARFVFYRCFGFIDHSAYSGDKFYNVGSISSGSVTANSVKELLMKAKTGAHVRLTRGHSISIFTMDDNYLTVYHGNAGGDGVASQPCVVSTKRYTWADFAAYAAAGISYVNMPYDYPGDKTDTQKKSEGFYNLKSKMNVRVGTGTLYKVMGQLDIGSCVKVLQVSNGWGRIEYNGSTNRWISLDYAEFQSLSSIKPKENAEISIDTSDGILLGTPEKTGFGVFKNKFVNQNLSVQDRYGNDLAYGGYIGTGSEVGIEVNGKVIDSKKILIKGDANGNGIVDVGDYLILKRIFLGNYTADSIYILAADINGDSKTDSTDCLLMKKYLVGTSDKLNVE